MGTNVLDCKYGCVFDSQSRELNVFLASVTRQNVTLCSDTQHTKQREFSGNVEVS